MRYILPISFLFGCTIDNSLTGEEEILLTALSGQEEVFSNHDIAARGMQNISEMPILFRQCDAQASFEDLFSQYDSNSNQELEQTEEEQVCSEHKERATHQQRRARHMMKLLEYVYDIDGDGVLSEEEKLPMYEDFNQRCEAIHSQIIEEFDVDGDGLLSEEERAAAHAEAQTRLHDGDRHSDHEDGEMHEGNHPEGNHGPGHHDEAQENHAEEGLPPFARSYDVDADGVLNATELETFRAETREAIRSGDAFAKRCGEREQQ